METVEEAAEGMSKRQSPPPSSPPLNSLQSSPPLKRRRWRRKWRRRRRRQPRKQPNSNLPQHRSLRIPLSIPLSSRSLGRERPYLPSWKERPRPVPRWSSWFTHSGRNIVNTRIMKRKYKRVTARTDRYATSAIAMMTTILNARDLEELERITRKQQEKVAGAK